LFQRLDCTPVNKNVSNVHIPKLNMLYHSNFKYKENYYSVEFQILLFTFIKKLFLFFNGNRSELCILTALLKVKLTQSTKKAFVM
jgi:hypothetical protein